MIITCANPNCRKELCDLGDEPRSESGLQTARSPVNVPVAVRRLLYGTLFRLRSGWDAECRRKGNTTLSSASIFREKSRLTPFEPGKARMEHSGDV